MGDAWFAVSRNVSSESERCCYENPCAICKLCFAWP